MIARKLRQLKPKGFVFLTLIIGIVYLAKDIIYPSYESLTSEDKEVQTEYVSVGYIQKSKEDDMRNEISQTNEEKLRNVILIAQYLTHFFVFNLIITSFIILSWFII